MTNFYSIIGCRGITGRRGRWFNSSFTREETSRNSSRYYLPPPPDIRQIVVKTPQRDTGLSVIHENVTQRLGPPVEKTSPLTPNLSPNGSITAINTTIIGDTTIQHLATNDSKWEVQILPEVTSASLQEKIENDAVNIYKRYIFLVVGGNNCYNIKKTEVFHQIRMICYAIFSRNEVAKIFFSGVLPQFKLLWMSRQQITQYNRYLCAAIKKLQKEFPRVCYIPSQLRFHDIQPANFFFEDTNSLNEYGCLRLKNALLEGAGFVSSNPVV